MKFTWIGGPSFRLELGPFVVVGDPVLGDQLTLDGAGVRRVNALPPVDVTGADLVLVTSARPDHCDSAGIAHCAAPELIGAEGVPGARVLALDQTRTLSKNDAGLVVHPVSAGDGACGFFLRLLDGAKTFTAYVTGDALFSEHTRALQRHYGYSNLLVVHIGAERADGVLRSADAKEAMQIVYRMQPNAIAAVHHSTFSHYTEPIDPFLEKIGLTIYENRLRRLREGESFEKAL
ncbi:MAG TPA: MBL fold metallo-hydrolase [Candidatus Krumholzibacteria bacterium]|nr:MBL fold metallo-hydrolase [Candidatus Krumholzibacteria bacterium]